jgi:glycosyltransferase involved in cell wall biosynthesis
MMRESKLNNDNRIMIESILTKKEELICFKNAHCSIVHTSEEAELVMKELPSLRMPILLPFVTPIVQSKTPYCDRIDVMFLGGYEHLPNVDAAVYFAKEVWPIIKGRLSKDSHLLLVGSKPNVDVKSLQSDDVIVTGQVPDLEPYFERAKVFIAPLRYGAGVKGKVITALAHGVPTVATDIAIEGIEIAHEEQVLCANGVKDFAENVIRLFEDEGLWSSLQNKGYEFVLNNSSEGIYEKICNDIVAEAYSEWMIRKDEEIFSELNPNLAINNEK